VKPNLNCQNFELRIHQLLDDRLTLSGDPVLMSHVAICADCEQLVKDFESLESSLNSLVLDSRFNQALPGAKNLKKSGKFADARSGLGFAVAIAAALLLVLGVFSFPENANSRNQNVSLLRLPTPTNGSTAHPQMLSITAPALVKKPHIAKADRPERFVRKLVFSRPPTTFVELAQTTPEFVSSVKLPSSGWEKWSVQLDPLNSYLQYSVEIPGIRSIQCSVEMTLDLLQRSLSNPEKPDQNLGWFPEAALFALA
jgi:hypothetical protein